MRILDDRRTQILLLGAAVLVSAAAFTHETADYVRFLNPWMDQIQAQGWRSIAGGFANYTPPYIYFMYLVSGVEPVIGNPAALKLINLPFLLAAMIAAYRIVAPLATPQRGLLAAVAVWVLPTVLVDTFIWGQCDIIFTALLLWHVRFVMSDRPTPAAVLFGAAIAFKLQAIFLGPLLLYYIWNRDRPVGANLPRFVAGLALQGAIIALTYAVLMVPAWIAGRAPLDLLLVYLRQADVYDQLAMNAPNLWYAATWAGLPTSPWTAVGLLATAATGLGMVLWSLTRRVEKTDILLIAAAAATWMPFLLPKMHDRYMFPADVLILLLALVRPRLLWVAALAQIGSLAAYGGYFGANRFLHGFQTPWIGVAAYTVVAIALLVEVLRLPGRSSTLADAT